MGDDFPIEDQQPLEDSLCGQFAHEGWTQAEGAVVGVWQHEYREAGSEEEGYEIENKGYERENEAYEREFEAQETCEYGPPAESESGEEFR
ncbi:MAG: hypothetical protein U0R26_01060 [Solirubrobacterales bacterium]